MPFSAQICTGSGFPMLTISLTDTDDLEKLARNAVEHMACRSPVVVSIAAPYDRPKGWPLPMKREANGQPMNYRPLAILDYVEYALAERDRARVSPDDCSDLV